MANHRNLVKRCELLEEWVREQRRDLDLQEKREEQWRKAFLQLLAVFPEERYEDLAALMESAAWPGSGLSAVLTMIWNGCWQPATIPPAVADVFLIELEAEPYARCAACAVVLPYRSGIWTNTATGSSWQGPLCYFRCCPCGGEIVNALGRPLDLRSWLPERVTPPWTFEPSWSRQPRPGKAGSES